MDAIKLLKLQHREIEELFHALDLEYEPPALKTRERWFERLADALAAHTLIEEQLFYPAARTEATAHLVDEAVREHRVAKELIVELLGLSAADDRFDERIAELRELIELHLREEESELLPALRKATSKQRLEQLGHAMEVRWQEAMAGQPRAQLQAEMAKVAPSGRNAPLGR